MKFALSILTVSLLLLQPASLHAHHAQSVFFHQDRTVEIKGAVKEWLFANPHPVLTVEVTEADGRKLEWAVQFAPATVLARRGWSKETFRPGDTVTAVGHPSKAPGTYGLEIIRISWADGSPVQ